MVLGIEASNILAGGGLTHLKELLSHAQPTSYGFQKVYIWSTQHILDQLPDQPWLEKKTHPWLNRSVFFRMLWLIFILPKEAKESIDVLFSPGANPVNFRPQVSMCQNLLPFDSKESKLYSFSWMRIRLLVLRYTQTKAFRNAQGIIVLTRSNIPYLSKRLDRQAKFSVIPHGINPSFFYAPSLKKLNEPIKLLYVSIVDVYKHQWNVVEALHVLLKKGYPVELTLVGGQYSPAWKKLKTSINIHPENACRITYLPAVPYDELNTIYQTADIFVFASSCETFSLVLLESMASGLPIVCADRDTLKDTLGDAGIYFDPYSSESIVNALIKLIEDPTLRHELSTKGYTRAQSYSWTVCADQTFQFLSNIANAK
ncbi:MAG: glycosyltransferase family 4 protein [Cytophagaceae bacterium]|nr:glycosyltransferase family 4 protein [Cytophagaceae bacterium]